MSHSKFVEAATIAISELKDPNRVSRVRIKALKANDAKAATMCEEYLSRG